MLCILQLWINLPAWLVSTCRENIHTASVMAGLKDGDMRIIGISHPLHRLKLRLATREIVHLTSQRSKIPMDLVG